MKSMGRRLAGTAAIGAMVVALTAGTIGGAQAATVAAPNAAALRASIAGYPNEEITSAVALVGGTGGHWSGTSGTGDPATGRPVKADGRFRIGSISKVFTATVLLQLAAEHRVDLDGTVQQYLPHTLPDGYPDVTVRQLLNHTSGLPTGGDLGGDDGGEAWFAAHPGEHWSPQEVVAEAMTHPKEFMPGTAQEYNGTNYFVAGLVIEKVTGRSFAQEVTDRILRPVGLHHTSVPAADDTALPDPTAHAVLAVPRPDGGTTLADVTRQSPWPWAEGGMISTAPDLERFFSALLHGELLPPAQQAELFAVPDVPNFRNHNCPGDHACFSTALMRFSPAPGVEFWGKTGTRPGYSSGVFGTRDGSRDLVYSFTPTSRFGASFAAQYRVFTAAFDLPTG